MAGADVRDKLATAGIEALSSTPKELSAFMDAELQKWSGHIRAAGIKPE